LQLCADGGYQLRLGVLGVPLIMVPDTHKRNAPIPASYCARLPRRRPHCREHPPPRRGPATPGTLRPNWTYPHDPLPPPVPRHHSSVTKPGSRRRTAADLTGGRTRPVRPPLLRPLHVVTPLLSLTRGPTPMASSHAAPLHRGPAGPPARARARWAEIPPGPAS
jgi:hypothetical protein